MSDEKMNAKLLVELKRHEPAKIVAYSGDDDARPIAVPTRRKRWAAVIAAINARSWSRVELQNKAGEMLACVDNTSPAGDVEELDGRAAKVRSEAEWAVSLALKTGRELLAFRSEEHTVLLRAQGEVVRELTQAMKGLAQIYGEQRDAAVDVAAMRAEADNGGDVKALLEAAPTILQVLPVLRDMMNGSKGGKH